MSAVFLIPPASAKENEKEKDRDDKIIAAKIEKLRAAGERLARRGKFADALEKLEQIVPLMEIPDSDLLYNLGVIAEAAKNCRKTVLFFHSFLYVSPGDPQEKQILTKLGRCLRGDKNGGTLVLDTKPREVEIRIDGLLIGRAPIYELKLVPGSYSVTANTPDYHPYRGTISIDVGLEAKHDISLEKMIYQGDLLVKSTPPGATVWLDTVQVGKTPYERKGLATRTYLVRVEMEGWDRWVRYVPIERNIVSTVEVKLEKTGMQVPIPPLPKN